LAENFTPEKVAIMLDTSQPNCYNGYVVLKGIYYNGKRDTRGNHRIVCYTVSMLHGIRNHTLYKEKVMATMVRPTRDVVVFGFEKTEKVSSGGIVLQDSTKLESTIGTVMGIGPDVQDVTVNDRIVADWTKAQDIGNNLLAIEEEHIQIILGEDD
jgi:co-chaperonin GroES (HSP10)